jgi:predicted O-methyltransferase YrrM
MLGGMRLRSLRAIARGAALAVRDPRALARLPDLLGRDAHERRCRAHVEALLGGAPRCVPLERLLAPGRARLPRLALLEAWTPVPDLLLLQGLASRFPHCHYFEIGTFRGESAVAVAEVADRVVTLSLPDERLRAFGSDPSFVATHRLFSSGHPRIEHLAGDSRDVDVAPYAGSVDVLFIDGDHSREAVASDTRRFWPVRRSEASVVVWHDAFWDPFRPRWEVLAGIADGLPEEYRSGLVQVSNTWSVAWLPDAASLPTVEQDYLPRVAFSAELEPVPVEDTIRNYRT